MTRVDPIADPFWRANLYNSVVPEWPIYAIRVNGEWLDVCATFPLTGQVLACPCDAAEPVYLVDVIDVDRTRALDGRAEEHPMAYDDPTIPRVGRNGYRVLAPLEPGMRTATPEAGRAAPATAKPLDVPRAVRAGRASKPAGYTR